MAKRPAFLRFINPKPLVRASRIRCGPLEARGVPAILLGAAAIVIASGASKALALGPSLIPETLREARAFWLAVRSPRPELAS